MNKIIYILTLLLFPTTLAIGQSEEKIMLNKGIEAYEKGNFSEALTFFNQANAKNADYTKAIYNAANAALLMDSTKIAKDLYTQYASSVEDKIEKSKAYYNIGNAFFKEYEKLAQNPENSQKSTKALKESIEYYKKALRNNPKDSDARYNLSLALSKLPPEQENDKNCDNPNKDNKDQDNKDNKDQQNKDNKDQNKDGQNKDDQNKDGKDGDQKDQQGKNGEDQKDQQGKDGDQKEEDGKNGDKESDEKGKDGEDKKEGEGKNGDKESDEKGDQQGQGKEGENGKEEEEMKGQISRMQAQKDLDAMNNDEQKILMKVNRKKGNHKQENKSEKDW